MSVGIQLLLIVLSVSALLVAMAVVRGLADRYGWSAELQRKSVHITTGLYALTLPLTFGKAWPVLLLCALSLVVMGVLRLPVLARSRLGSTIHGVERQSYGELLLVLAVGFTFFRATAEPVLYVLPLLILTFCDAAAALAGVRYGKKNFAIENGTKSLEGVAVFFLLTFIITIVTLLLMTDVSRIGVILLSLIVAAFGAQIEADSWRGFDNLFIPVGLQLFLQNNLAASPEGLAGTVVLYGAILLVLGLATPSLGLTRHAARAYGVLAFLILSVTSTHNTLLPLSAFLSFVALRKAVPCRSAFPDLDFIAAMAVIATLWLFLGEIAGHTAIDSYNLTFAGVATLFVTLALGRRVIAAALIALCLCLAVAFTSTLNFAHTPVRLAIWTAASLLACCAFGWLWPDAFNNRRALKAFALALPVPLALFTLESFSP